MSAKISQWAEYQIGNLCIHWCEASFLVTVDTVHMFNSHFVSYFMTLKILDKSHMYSIVLCFATQLMLRLWQ